MSILEAVEALERDGRLFNRPSSFTGEGPRSVYLTPEIDCRTQGPFSLSQEDQMWREVSDYLDAFVEHSCFSVSPVHKPKPPDVMLARVESVGVASRDHDFWSMRIADPDDLPHTGGVRLLGAFVDCDKFVALIGDFRQDMVFNASVSELGDVWHDHFGTLKPHSGSNLNDYLTNYTQC